MIEVGYVIDGHPLVVPSKIEALEIGKRLGRKPRFYYFDSVFEAVDWKSEPPESLERLYRERAQQLRDQYSKISLFFSGGFDSTNVLETFVSNGIHLDEVVVMGAFSCDPESGSDENQNAEAYKNAFPLLGRLGLGSTKVTVMDYKRALERPMYSDGTWVYQYGSNVSPWNWMFSSPDNFGTTEGKPSLLLFGGDKPNIVKLENGSHALNFMDKSHLAYGGCVNWRDGSTQMRNFYSDVDSHKIMRKQCHAVLKRVANLRATGNMFTPFGSPYYEAFVASVIYRLENSLVAKSPKSKSHIFSSRDNHLFKGPPSEARSVFLQGVGEIKNLLGEKWHDIFNAPLRSRYYFLD